jgi:hypothetical protein
MHIHLEGPTGPHAEIRLPAADGKEFETPIPDNEENDLDNEGQIEVTKPVYIN